MLTVSLVFLLFCNRVLADFPSCEIYKTNINQLLLAETIKLPDVVKIFEEHARDMLKTHFENRVAESTKRYTDQLLQHCGRRERFNKMRFYKQIDKISFRRQLAIKDINTQIEMNTFNINTFFNKVLKQDRKEFEEFMKKICETMLEAMWVTTAVMDNKMKDINKKADQMTAFPWIDFPWFVTPKDIDLPASEPSESDPPNQSGEAQKIDVRAKNKNLVETIESKFYELVATTVEHIKSTVGQRRTDLIDMVKLMISEEAMEEPPFKNGDEIILKYQAKKWEDINKILESFRNAITKYLMEHPPSEEIAEAGYTVDYVRGIGRTLLVDIFHALQLNATRSEIERYFLILNYELTYSWQFKVKEEAAKGWN